jgi:aspartyl protease family protein
MATGFMGARGMRMLDCMACALLLAASAAAHATDVRVVGLSANKAVISIDGGAPRTIAIGQKTAEGVTLVSVGDETATLDIDGKRRTLRMGQMYQATAGNAASVRLQADGRGHFIADGAINGAATRFLVDTGATVIALSAEEAKRMGISYVNGQAGVVQTAAGPTQAYRVTLDSVRVGGVTLNGLDAVVVERGLTVNLLGMNFLNRMEMRRDGDTMVLTKRF